MRLAAGERYLPSLAALCEMAAPFSPAELVYLTRTATSTAHHLCYTYIQH